MRGAWEGLPEEGRQQDENGPGHHQREDRLINA